MAVGEHEEQAFDLDLLATAEQRREGSWAQRRQAFERHVEVVKARLIRQLVQRLKDRAFRRRHHQFPVPWQGRRCFSLIISRVIDTQHRVGEQRYAACAQVGVERQFLEPVGNF